MRATERIRVHQHHTLPGFVGSYGEVDGPRGLAGAAFLRCQGDDLHTARHLAPDLMTLSSRCITVCKRISKAAPTLGSSAERMSSCNKFKTACRGTMGMRYRRLIVPTSQT
jgi:hypothetical protein